MTSTGLLNNVTTLPRTPYILYRVNVNTASADVLTALFMASGNRRFLCRKRRANAGHLPPAKSRRLSSVAWVIDALGNTSIRSSGALQRGDYITSHSYQFTADIAAVGSFGRGYRRVKFIFDISDGTPKILYRQDLSRLGWALGEKAG